MPSSIVHYLFGLFDQNGLKILKLFVGAAIATTLAAGHKASGGRHGRRGVAHFLVAFSAAISFSAAIASGAAITFATTDNH